MMHYDKKIRNSVIALICAIVITIATVMASYFAIYGPHGVTLLGNKDKKASAYANAQAEQGATVFLGDSITEMCNLAEFYPTVNSCNRGISGDTTSGMLRRLESNALDLAPAKLVFLGGTNDIGKGVPPQEIAKNIQSIIVKTRATLPACKIFIQSVYPVNAIIKPTFFSKTGCRNNKTIDELNSLLQDICDAYDCVYIDVNSSLKDKAGNLNNRYTLDGLHLTKDGYSRVASVVTPYII
ncbi:MAG: lysophospholipase [Clostridia bacterium]|nr:lysophospholipase [Clostridia bacterium]